MRQNLLGLAFVGFLAVTNTGCIKKMILAETIKQTRVGAGAANTIADYEVIRPAAAAAVLQFEGMHRLAPDNEDALFMLCRGWAGWGYGFAEDDFLVASLAGDESLAEYHRARAKLAYDRSISYGLELLAKTDEGFPKAKKNADTLRAWLKENFDDAEDAEPLFWLGSASIARVNLAKDDSAVLGEAFVGIAILQQSVALDPSFDSYGAMATIAAYDAGVGSFDEAKKLLDTALEKTKHKALGIQLNYARYACGRADQPLYEKMLNEIIAAEDSGTDPDLRLENAIAKRRAKRALTKAGMDDCSFPPPSTPQASPPHAK